MENERVRRVGLLATQAIRGGANRDVLKRIQKTGNIFWAWSDRKWMLAGAAVNVAMVAFDGGEQEGFELDGTPVPHINTNLSFGTDSPSALRLSENEGICFMGITKVGTFELDEQTAKKMLRSPINVNGRPNSDVVRRWYNGLDITRRDREMYIIDFGISMSEKEASFYEQPFQWLISRVKPYRATAKSGDATGVVWWRFQRSRPEMRQALDGLARYIVSARVSKHRTFTFVDAAVVPDNALYVFARSDYYFLGNLHARAHSVWALRQGTQLEDRPRYTTNTTFDTFPLPWAPGCESQDDPRVQAIAAAAKNLIELRERWLNPPDTPEAELAKRTLTNLYNKRLLGEMQWLDDAHRTLDHAVFAAYGWPTDLTDQQLLEKLLALNHERAAAQELLKPPKAPKKKAAARQPETAS